MKLGEAYGPPLPPEDSGMVTFIGPHPGITFGGFLFVKDQPRPVPDDVIEGLRDHPWFLVPEKVKRNARKG